MRQLRLRDIGGIIVVDFIDMVLESNRDLVLRRLLECLGRDRTKHQVAEVTSLGLVQMTRKRVGQGLLEVFSEPCEHCNGRGVIVHARAGREQGPRRQRAESRPSYGRRRQRSAQRRSTPPPRRAAAAAEEPRGRGRRRRADAGRGRKRSPGRPRPPGVLPRRAQARRTPSAHDAAGRRRRPTAPRPAGRRGGRPRPAAAPRPRRCQPSRSLTADAAGRRRGARRRATRSAGPASRRRRCAVADGAEAVTTV